MKPSPDLKKLLQGAGLKATSQRMLILEVLCNSDAPLSAPQIHERLKTKLDRATVYRVLEALADAGLAARLRHGERAHAYHLVQENRRPRHPHFYCTSCGNSSCLDASAVAVDLSKLGKSFPAQVESLEISLEGVCPDCLNHHKD